MKSVWQQIADDYHKAHPDVSFTVEPIQNEQFQTKVPLALQGEHPAGPLPAVGRRSARLADHAPARSPTSRRRRRAGSARWGRPPTGWQVDGKQYGVPYQMHAVGFWYRKDLFTQAGITTPPIHTGRTERRRGQAEDGGPHADRHRWQGPLAGRVLLGLLRRPPVLGRHAEEGREKTELSDPCFTKAGENLKSFLDTKPFQDGFVGTAGAAGRGQFGRAWSRTARPPWSCRATGSRT